jgi:hypothetical protein
MKVVPLSLNPLKILEKAVQQVPPLKYAFGVLGLVSVIAIVVGLKVDLRIAAFGVIVVLILMVLLVVFAQLVQ